MGSRSRKTERYQTLPFDHPCVLIYRWIGHPIYRAAWPSYFNAINLVRRPYPQNLPWVVRSQIAAAFVFKAAFLHATDDPGNNRSDRSGITLGGDQLQSNPIVPVIALVVQQKRRLAVVTDQHVEIAVIVKVSDGQSARWIAFREDRT